MIIVFFFLKSDSDIIIVDLYSILIFLLFSKLNASPPYYRISVIKIILIQYSIITWTAMSLIFGKIVEEIAFDANLIVWGVGSFFLITLIIAP